MGVGFTDDKEICGKENWRTVAWLLSREGHSVPVRRCEISAQVVREVGGDLRGQSYVVEKVVSLTIDLFPWHEVEAFAATLQDGGFRLLPTPLACIEYTDNTELTQQSEQDRR